MPRSTTDKKKLDVDVKKLRLKLCKKNIYPGYHRGILSFTYRR